MRHVATEKGKTAPAAVRNRSRSQTATAADTEIRSQIAADPDVAPELDAAWFAKARVVKRAPKEAISFRVDPDVLEFFRKEGPGDQSRMNAVLRSFVELALGLPGMAPVARTPRGKRVHIAKKK